MLGVLDGWLRKRGDYLLGGAFSLADLTVASAVTYSVYCGVITKDHPSVTAWLERCRARPTFEASWS